MKYAILVLGLLAALCTNAQDHLKDFALQRSLKQDGLQFNFTVLDDDKRGVRNHSASKFYFWTKAQHVQSTQGASSGDLLHGIFEAFYPSKQLERKGQFKRGLKHGTWSFWHEDGTYSHIEHWRKGKLCGKQQYFDADGELIRTEFIRGNKKKRIQPDTTVLWKSFDRKTIILKDSLGRKTEVQHFKNGKLHGAHKFYRDGKLDHKVKYKRGELVENKKEKKEKEENSEVSESDGELEEPVEEEPGKLKSLWKKWFSKDKKEDKKKESDKDKKTENAS